MSHSHKHFNSSKFHTIKAEMKVDHTEKCSKTFIWYIWLLLHVNILDKTDDMQSVLLFIPHAYRHALPSIPVAARCRWGLESRRMHFHPAWMTFAFRNTRSKLGFSLPVSFTWKYGCRNICAVTARGKTFRTHSIKHLHFDFHFPFLHAKRLRPTSW